jgi:cytochrome-b5 reductase
MRCVCAMVFCFVNDGQTKWGASQPSICNVCNMPHLFCRRATMMRPANVHRRRLQAAWVASTALWNTSAGSAAAADSQSCSLSTDASCSAPPGVPSYPLLGKWRQSNDSWLLRFGLPADRLRLGDDPTLPTCISVHYNGTSKDGSAALLKKSYSPTSHPSTTETFDLLVKAYPPRPGGGVGAAICALEPGQRLHGKLKSERMVHGNPRIAKRWDRIGLIAGGTGVAPLVQIIRIVLEDPTDRTQIQLLSINRYEEDILMRQELDELAKQHPDRFSVSYSLTAKSLSHDWDGYTGRGSVEMAKRALPPPSDDQRSTMIFVCGTDGFRDMWAGPIARAPPLADGSKGPKIQGPLDGILREAGYAATDVFKY